MKDSILYKALLLSASLFYSGVINNAIGLIKEGKKSIESAYKLACLYFPKTASVSEKIAAVLQSFNKDNDRNTKKNARRVTSVNFCHLNKENENGPKLKGASKGSMKKMKKNKRHESCSIFNDLHS